MKFRFLFQLNAHFSSWYLTPSVRVGWYRDGGWLGATFLRSDICVMWSREAVTA